MTLERASEEWYYRRDGQQVGPVSRQELEGLLVAGQLQPRQPVWQRGPHGMLFVPAATAAGGAQGATRPEGASGLEPA
jgi:uncharacterized protein DUF4339